PGATALADQDRRPWLVRAQAGDGRFPALWRPADAGPDEVPASEHDLRTTAFAALAMLGDGSTMRSGPYRPQVKRAVFWLIGRRDERGRLGFAVGPDWILDHAVATAALCEAASLSEYALMHVRIAGPIEVLVDHLRRFNAGVDVELLVWCRIAARAASAYEDWWNQRPAAVASFDSGAAALEFEVARLAATGARVAGARGEA